MLSKLLSTIAGKVAVGVVIGLIILCSTLFIKILFNNTEIQKLTSNVSELSTRNSVLEGQVNGYKNYIDTTIQASKKQQEVISELNSSNQQSLEKLNKVTETIEKNNDKNTTGDVPLSSDFARLLQQHCNKVSGEVCSNP